MGHTASSVSANNFYDDRDSICDSGQFRGCDVRIFLDSFGVEHEGRLTGRRHTPCVRSYENGIKVGCTFITNDALRKIAEWQRCFVGNKSEKTWQSETERK